MVEKAGRSPRAGGADNDRAHPVAATKPLPNILYIFTDQQSHDAMSCAGNTWLNTPAMDRLAADGVRFETAYCTFPLCTPSRASMFSGFYPNQCGVTWNEESMSAKAREEGIGNLLSRAGYDCAYGGKWHIPWASPMEAGHGFEYINAFDDFTLADDVVAFMGRERSAPFFVVASFDNPHSICEVASGRPLPWGEVAERVTTADCPPLPANFASSPYEPEPIRCRQNEGRTADEWRRYRFTYDRIVEKVDHEIGRILDGLDHLGLTEETLVIFSSDHGENRGGHQLSAKLTFNDESVRVPFIVRWPGRISGGRTETGALLSAGLDLYPTLCAVAGVAMPSQRPGVNLLPLLTGAESGHHREAVIAMTRGGSNNQGRMVRTRRYKYIAYEHGRHREQLFDMETDPGEMVNLAVCGRFSGTLQEHREILRSWCLYTADRFGYHYTHPRLPFMIPGDAYGPDTGGLPPDFPLSQPPGA